MMIGIRYLITAILVCLCMGCKPTANPPFPAIENQLRYSSAKQYDYEVIKAYPHQPKTFTEGLVWDQGYLFESSGIYGRSFLRKMDATSGKIVKQQALPAKYFGEGITILNQHLYQLTYKEHRAFQYNKNTFSLQKIFKLPTQGWGLTTDGQQLIMSDGTDIIRFIQPETFQVLREIRVHTNKQALSFINELEYVNGIIYANVWPSNFVVMIAKEDGKVVGWFTLKALNRCSGEFECLPNGIAFDKVTQTLFVTGKYWQQIYAIRLNDKS